MNADLSPQRLVEIRASVAAHPHPAPGTLALALRELLAEVDRLHTIRCHAGALAEQRHQLLDPAEPPLCVAAIATPTAPAVAA